VCEVKLCDRCDGVLHNNPKIRLFTSHKRRVVRSSTELRILLPRYNNLVDDKVHCSGCSSTLPIFATQLCIECNTRLCLVCHELAHFKKEFQKHHVFPLEFCDYCPLLFSLLSDPDHDKNTRFVSTYCAECGKGFCDRCFGLTHQNINHFAFPFGISFTILIHNLSHSPK
jgi:hypothetical protein